MTFNIIMDKNIIKLFLSIFKYIIIFLEAIMITVFLYVIYKDSIWFQRIFDLVLIIPIISVYISVMFAPFLAFFVLLIGIA